MPTSAPRPCTHTGCPALTTTGRCPDHKHDGWNAHQAGRTTTQRGYGAKWRKLRAKVLKRDQHLCQACMPVLTKATEVDHIKRKEDGGTDALSNLQSLCTPCHATKTAKERRNG